MLIHFDDPIWDRLYCPGSRKSAAIELREFARTHKVHKIRNLFIHKMVWGDMVGPAGYAALPHVWEYLRNHPQNEDTAYEGTAYFCYQVARDSIHPDTGAMDPLHFRGLKINLNNYKMVRLPKKRWMKEEDLPVLTLLRDWMFQHYGEIALTCARALTGAKEKKNPILAAPLALHLGGPQLAGFIAHLPWTNVNSLSDRVTFTPRHADQTAARELLEMVGPVHHSLSRRIKGWAKLRPQSAAQTSFDF